MDRRTAGPRTGNQDGANWEAIGLAGLAVVTFAVSAALSRKDSQDSGNARLGQSVGSRGSKQLGRATLAALAAPAAAKGAVKLFDYVSKLEVTMPASAPPLIVAAPASFSENERVESTVEPPPPDARYLSLAPHPSVLLTIGRRGSGKSALNWRLLELFRNQALPYAVGLPAAAQKLVPDWVGLVDRLEDAPHGAVVLVDESFLEFSSRASMTERGRGIGALINLSRQRKQSILFVVQQASSLDRDIVSQIDCLIIKELSDLSDGYDRPQLRRITDRAKAAFQAIRGNKKSWAYVYSEVAGDVGLVENLQPSFWRSGLSHVYADAVGPQQTDRRPTRHRKGVKTPREDLVAEAKSLIDGGYSYRQAAQVMGLPRATVWDLINRPSPEDM